jgi:hypothetical protein
MLCACPFLAHAQGELALDHLFVVVDHGAPESEVLQRAGLHQAPDPVVHEGQGTASVFFFFENVYLELVWVDQPGLLDEVLPELAERTGGASGNPSPFGIGLRRAGDEPAELPFPTRPHTADWMKPETAIGIAAAQPASEPMIFVVPGYMGWPEFVATDPEVGDQMDHPAAMRRLTEVRLHGPAGTHRSRAMRSLVDTGLINRSDSSDHLLELVFDEGRRGKTLDGRPDLPLMIRY